jgi:hypothetical protein
MASVPNVRAKPETRVVLSADRRDVENFIIGLQNIAVVVPVNPYCAAGSTFRHGDLSVLIF